MMTKTTKPLGSKCYGSIPHLPGSRMGPADHHRHAGQEVICTKKARDRHDKIIVQEKYDGSCVGVYRAGNEILPLTRAGYLANTSPYEQHHLFYTWALENRQRFLDIVLDGERLVGEWLAQAHGTRYEINCLFEQFVAFDIMRGGERLLFDGFIGRIVCGHGEGDTPQGFQTPRVLGYGPHNIEEAMQKCHEGGPWRIDIEEGVVFRVERKGKVDFLAKYVRPDKKDGIFLPEVSGLDAVWNWHPAKPSHGLTKYPK